MVHLKLEIIIPGKLEMATLLSRENRFIVIVDYNGSSLRCHLPNPGRMIEFLHPKKKVYIRLSDNPNRKTAATLVAIDFDGEIIQLDSNLVTILIPKMLEKQFPGLNGYNLLKKEYTVGKHRYDYLIEKNGVETLVEVKSTTRVVDDVACFPDAVSKRAQSHLSTLIELSESRQCMLIFMVYRPARSISACRDIDPVFADIFDRAIVSDVSILAFQCSSKIVEDSKLLCVSVDNLIENIR